MYMDFITPHNYGIHEVPTPSLYVPMVSIANTVRIKLSLSLASVLCISLEYTLAAEPFLTAVAGYVGEGLKWRIKYRITPTVMKPLVFFFY